jgi:hypothetical protein
MVHPVATVPKSEASCQRILNITTTKWCVTVWGSLLNKSCDTISCIRKERKEKKKKKEEKRERGIMYTIKFISLNSVISALTV